jgi:hypothetical protein
MCAAREAPGQPAAAAERPLPAYLDELRRASDGWRRRPGPERSVIDQVCLVPDLPTFLEAVAAWDERHYFPILIDDIELTFKFLRAFRPARIVRYPRKAAAIPPEQLWTRVRAAVGRAWTADDPGGGSTGDAVPKSLGATPPGVVLSSPEGPMLAGAVALAAGRFQPLLRWDVSKHYPDVLAADEAEELARSLERVVAAAVPNHAHLGDDCDFVTLAGDWPYRYNPRDAAAR